MYNKNIMNKELSIRGNAEDNMVDAIKLRAALVQGQYIKRQYLVQETTSTNRLAEEAAVAGQAEEGLLVLAGRQTEARGRKERSWQSPMGGLWFSLVWRPELRRKDWPLLSLLAGNAVLAAVRPYYEVLSLKWPNDVYAGERKLSGVLLQVAGDFIIAGFGVNVNNPMQEALGEFKAVALAELCKRHIALTPLLIAIVREFEQRYHELLQNGPNQLLHEYRAHCGHLGTPCAVLRDGQWLKGVSTDIDEHGCLLLEVRGRTERISAGDVFIIEREELPCI